MSSPSSPSFDRSNKSYSYSHQEQIPKEKEKKTPKRMLITLVSRKMINEKGIANLSPEQTAEQAAEYAAAQIHGVFQDTITESTTQSSSTIPANKRVNREIEKSAYYSLSEDESTEAEQVGEEKEPAVNEREKKVLEDEKKIIEFGIGAEENQAIIETEVGTLSEAAGHLLYEAVIENPTRALTTAATALGVPIALFANPVGLTMGAILTAATTVIAGKQILNMIFEKAKDKGASDPLRAVEKSIEIIGNLAAKTKVQLDQASEKIKGVNSGIEDIGVQIENLKAQLEEADEKLKGTITEMITNLEDQKNVLLSQKEHLEASEKNLKEISKILGEQSAKLTALLDKKYDTSTQELAEEAIESIKAQIAAIKETSDKTQELLVKVIESQSDAIDDNKTLFKILTQITGLVTKLAETQKELDDAKIKVGALEEKNAELSKNVEELKSNLEETQKTVEKLEPQLELAKDQTERSKKQRAGLVEPMGASLVGGNTVGLSAGTAAGILIVGGTAGAVIGALVGSTLLAPFAIKGIHDFRMYHRGLQNAQMEMSFINLEKALETSPIQSESPISVTAEYGEVSQGNLLGTGGWKTVWNFAAEQVTKLTPKLEVKKYKSARSGTTTCQIGKVVFKFTFDVGPGHSIVYNTFNVPLVGELFGISSEVKKIEDAKENYDTHGAMSIPDQQQLIAVLAKAVDMGWIHPVKALELLNLLKNVSISETESVCMIRENSPVAGWFRDECEKTIKSLL